MSQLNNFIFGNNPPESEFDKDLEKNLDKLLQQLRNILNNGLRLEDNFDSYRTTITTDATPGNATVITHSLKRTPIACIVLEQDKAGSIFKSASDSTTYTIKSDVATMTASVLII